LAAVSLGSVHPRGDFPDLKGRAPERSGQSF